MAQHQNTTSSLPLAVLAALLLLLVAATTTEARVLRRVNHRSLLDAAAACQTASFPKLCDSLAQSDGRSVGSLTEAAIHEAASKAKEAENLAARLMAAPGTDKMVAKSLDVCRQNFESAVDSLHEAANYVKEAARHADLMINLSAAVTYVVTCDDAFSERPGLVSPVAQINANLQKLVSNSLELGASLKN